MLITTPFWEGNLEGLPGSRKIRSPSEYFLLPAIKGFRISEFFAASLNIIISPSAFKERCTGIY